MPRKKNAKKSIGSGGRDGKKQTIDLTVDDPPSEDISYEETHPHDGDQYEEVPDDWQEARRLIDSGGMRVLDN